MTNSYDVDHGLSQDAPGPLEPVEVAKVPESMNTNNGWLDIASAPKTGRTLLLGYWNSHGKWRTVRGQWVSTDHIAESFEDPDDAEEGWFETSAEADDVPNCWPVTPSHWQPLPAAPASPVSTVEQGDALALLDHPLLRDVLGYIEDAGPADVWSAAQAWMALRDAALSAAPAAGDAQLLAALQQAHMALIGFMPQHRNAVIVNAIVAAREAIDAAKAAQRQGDA